MTKALVSLLIIALVASPDIIAAQDAVAMRVQGSLDTRMVQPECKIEGGDFRVSSGKTYLKTGIEGTGDPSNRVNALRNGARVITEAITVGKQSKSSAAWYWLGRTYLQQGDLVGADSAFTRTVALAPGCKDDIRKYRYRAWAALVNAGSSFRQANQTDSAMVMYRSANLIFSEGPLSYVNMADIFNASNQTDSALHYFGRAAATEPTDPQQIKLRDQAAFNHGVLLLNSGRSTEAIGVFRRYLTLQPDDMSARKGLAQAFRAAGMPDSAQAIERDLVAGAGAGAATPDAGEALSEGDLMDIGVRQFNDKNYREAAATFDRIVALNAWNRDALYNLANAYLAQQDGAKLAAAAEQLIGIEPLAEYDHSLRLEGYKLAGNQNARLEASIAREALPVNLEIERMVVTADGATLSGKLTGREARDEKSKLIPARPLTITVEFLTTSGNVAASQDVQVAALKGGETAAFRATAKAPGIKAWRYRVK